MIGTITVEFCHWEEGLDSNSKYNIERWEITVIAKEQRGVGGVQWMENY